MSAAPTTYANHLAVHRALDAAPVLAKAGMGKSEQLVLVVIARHLGHGDHGTCWLGYETIGQEAQMSRRWAIEAVGRLAGAKIVHILSREGRTNLYSIDFDQCTEFTREATSPVNSVHPTSEVSSPRGETSSRVGVKPVHPK